ncbi:DUF2017 family protein [Cryobacterium sp. PAMC25264]|uniref:DUF2017 family protein n=1 Tax=Cryobacterium sp. PAMC25264 TaxID=2861288 RepID=UPI001C63293C|nr:DUF2017 family protein [Cryobacterium sp. PAMC25264]QYF74606.1 DUF2017 domain-containing protein [Cryobacterium sp. PAMC25264]
MDFRREDSSTVSAMFEPVEADLLRQVAGQLIGMLESIDTDDPGSFSLAAVSRLLPAAYPDDPEASAEFRRFTADGLLEGKIANARSVIALLGVEPQDAQGHDPLPVPVVLDPAGVQSWLRTLTDLRLVIAERLQVDDRGIPRLHDDQSGFLGEVYDWLGMVQESLVYAIDA